MSFTFERVRQHTGKVQYRTDGASATGVAGKTVKRGEVIAAPKKSFADALVSGGNFAHAPGDAPLGVPKTKATDKAAGKTAETAPLIDDEREEF